MNRSGELDKLVSRPDERLARVAWAGPQPFEGGAVQAGAALVLCGGFEDRAIGALPSFSEATGDLAVILVRYRPEYPENRDQGILEWAKNYKRDVRDCIYDRQAPAGGGEAVVDLLGNAKHVYVDVSGMSRLLIVQIVVALVQTGRCFTVIYTEAAEYFPTRTEFDRELTISTKVRALDFLSSGIFEVAATPELGSVSMLGEATRLIVFPSMEEVQMRNLLQEIQPTYVDVVHGMRPDSSNHWRREAVERVNASALEGQTGVSGHEASTLDYRETLRVLLRVYEERSMFDRMLVAPTGSKMQAVAVGLVRAALKDLQVVYPTPQVLRAGHYTRGVGRVHQISVPRVLDDGNSMDTPADSQ